jgi:signal transduction histidine kinase
LFHNIEVKKKLDQSMPITFADPDLIKQVILNIVLNGAQAMDGKGILTIRSLPINGGKKIQIQIGDTGIGITEEHLHRLFDPFFTTKEKGTGLGLALVYGIVSKHQGSIHVESEVGNGTTFFIDLPVLDQAEWMKSEKGRVEIKSEEGEEEGETQGKNLIG